ncbi:MAG: metalloregulator ArsR/SmtB family transcription factor [Terracidiphilus sp.]
MVTHSRTVSSAPTPNVYRAIADPTRRAILDRLRAGPMHVNALAADFRQSRPAVSKHLRVLRAARLVAERRSGRERHYSLEPKPLRDVARWVEEYRVFWKTSLNSLKRYLETENKNSKGKNKAGQVKTGRSRRDGRDDD